MDYPLEGALGPYLQRPPPRGAQAGSDVGWSRVPGAPVGGGRRSQQMVRTGLRLSRASPDKSEPELWAGHCLWAMQPNHPFLDK